MPSGGVHDGLGCLVIEVRLTCVGFDHGITGSTSEDLKMGNLSLE